MNVNEILGKLTTLANSTRVKHMEQFGINTQQALGISIYELRKIAKDISKNHQLALDLWKTGIHEARILACYVDDISKVTENQLELWVKDLNSWDLCDQCCCNHFDKTPFAYKKAIEWSDRKEEFVKRAGFVLMASLAIHDKNAKDELFDPFLKRIKESSDDNRIYVKKAVNWSLRQIGKRDTVLHTKAIQTAQDILRQNSKSGQWIATDALRELTSKKVVNRVNKIN